MGLCDIPDFLKHYFGPRVSRKVSLVIAFVRVCVSVYKYLRDHSSVFLVFCMNWGHLKARGGVWGVKKTSLAYIKDQPVMELLLFTELKNLRLWRKYGASKFGGITQSHTKYRGVIWPKTTILDQYFQKYLSLSVQTCLKVRFYQVLHVSVGFMCPFFTKTRFSQNHLK